MKSTRFIAALLTFAAIGAAQAQTTFSENFDNMHWLAQRGWQTWNLSEGSTGLGWFQGSAGALGTFDPAHLGFAAADRYNTTEGALSVWLISPPIPLSGLDRLEFSLASAAPGTDGLRVRVGPVSVYSPDDFQQVIFDIGNVPDMWLSFAPYLPQNGAAVRIAFEYYGSFDASSYVGIDNMSVTAVPVPEPGAAALLAAGLAGLALLRRRVAAR